MLRRLKNWSPYTLCARNKVARGLPQRLQRVNAQLSCALAGTFASVPAYRLGPDRNLEADSNVAAKERVKASTTVRHNQRYGKFLALALLALPAPALAEPLPDHLSRAASCAARLMNAEPVLPDRYLDRVPGPKFCEAGGRETCGGTFFAIRGRTYIVAPSGAFETLVHEACHAIQFAQGRELREPECEAAQAWAWSCQPGATP